MIRLPSPTSRLEAFVPGALGYSFGLPVRLGFLRHLYWSFEVFVWPSGAAWDFEALALEL